MPFTLSHAAAALPGLRLDGSARGPFVASALVLGTFAPDVPYFLSVPGLGRLTHSAAAVVTIDVLIASVLFGLWLVVRAPAVALLPRRLQGPVWSLVGGRKHQHRGRGEVLAWFYGSAALGAATHVFWDSFTHAGRWGVEQVPVLDSAIAGRPLFGYLQHVSSLVGLAAVAVFVVVALRRNASTPPPEGLPVVRTSGKVLASAMIGGCVLLSLRRVHVSAPLELLLVDAAFAVGAGLAAGLLLYALAFRAVRRALRDAA